MFCVYDANTSVFILGTFFWSAAALYCRKKLENLQRTSKQTDRQTDKQTNREFKYRGHSYPLWIVGVSGPTTWYHDIMISYQLRGEWATTHYTLYTTHYILHTTHYTLHTTHYTLHTTHYTLHTTYWTLHTTHYTLHTTHSCSPKIF